MIYWFNMADQIANYICSKKNEYEKANCNKRNIILNIYNYCNQGLMKSPLHIIHLFINKSSFPLVL